MHCDPDAAQDVGGEMRAVKKLGWVGVATEVRAVRAG